jgi:hypothetical protein
MENGASSLAGRCFVPDFRCGSKTVLAALNVDVRSTPNQRTSPTDSVGPFRATTGLMQRGKRPLFDHPVGHRKQGWRNFDRERFCSVEVDNQLEFCWLLDR